MTAPDGGHPFASGEPTSDEAAARARADAAVIIRAAEDQAAAIVRDAEARARRLVADAVRAGRDRLAELGAEEREARLRLVAAQHELHHILEGITRSADTLIDLTGAEVRFGLSARPRGERAHDLAAAPAIDDPSNVDLMVRRAVDEALGRASSPAGR